MVSTIAYQSQIICNESKNNTYKTAKVHGMVNAQDWQETLKELGKISHLFSKVNKFLESWN